MAASLAQWMADKTELGWTLETVNRERSSEEKMKAERERWRDRGWRKRVNWKRNREEGPDLRGCGVASLSLSLYITTYMCVCVRACACTRVFVCLRGDSVVDLMRAKLIRDFALHSSTMTFPQELGHHLPPILHPPEQERHCRDVFIHRLKLILQASGKWKSLSYMSEAGSVKGS